MTPTRRWSVALASLVAIVWALPAAAAEKSQPLVSRQQVEADWLRQDEVRQASRGTAFTADGRKVKPEDDAQGAIDGRKDGKWGFHTENEAKPWWQVDLGEPVAIDRLVVFNRCDGGFAARAARMLVLVSDDAVRFEQVYQHDGSTFQGEPDGKPLVVRLDGRKARYVRLQLPGTSYFHLDEVEVYASGGKQNIALGRPATQSSVSQWSVAHSARPSSATSSSAPPAATPAKVTDDREYPISLAIERGRKLAAHLAAEGVDVLAEVESLDALQAKADRLGHSAAAAERRQIYFDVRWAVRRLALKNPLLDFDHILFCKAAPTRFPHMSDQFYGWWSRAGGGVFVLENWKSEHARLRCLTADFPPGSFLRPELSYDGQRALFAYCRSYDHVPELKDKVTKANLPEDAFYHIFEINLDGSGLRQLTRGRYDDFDARYLPSGEIVFLSTRKGQFLQCAKAATQQTAEHDLPDSYVRCGGGDYRPVPVFTLHAMDADGENLRPLSAFENFEWTPAVAADGRILYTRWDYIDRFNGHFFSLWSTNADGSNAQLVYGNYTVRPQVVAEAMSIPRSTRLVATACAHHSILGGSLVLLDRDRGTEEAAPVTRLTPEVPFPETEANGPCYYVNPWPLSEEHFLVAFSDRRLPPHTRVEDAERNPPNATGLYLYDAFGNLNLIYRDAEISSGNPIPVRPRPRPPAYADTVDHQQHEGQFLVQNVYEGLAGVPRGSIKRLRVVAVPPKVQPHMNNPVLGVSKEDPGKFVLGTVPVEADGSAYFRVPSGVSLLFQALDADGLAVQTMRSLTYVQPGQTLSCIGCHEHRDLAPTTGSPLPLAAGTTKWSGSGVRVVGTETTSPLPLAGEGSGVRAVRSKITSPLPLAGEGPGVRVVRSGESPATTISFGPPLAALREPSPLTLGPAGSWPLKFSELVQPVLDRQCVSCHRPTGDDPAAARFDLTAARAYDSLLGYADKDIERLAFEKDRSTIGDCVARRSKLWALLLPPSKPAESSGGRDHYGVKLTADDRQRLATWLDTYAHRIGHFSIEQEEQLRAMKDLWRSMLSGE